MERLLKKIDFTNNELKEYAPEIRRFADILCLTEPTLAAAAESLDTCFDLSFDSVRMLLKELVMVVLRDLRRFTANDGPITQMAVPMPIAVAGVIDTLSPDMAVTSSEYLIVYLAGILFNVYHHICHGNTGKCNRCGLNLSRETLYANAAYPRPDSILSCFAYCDELYKAGEILSLRHGVHHIHLSDIKGISYAEQEDYLCRALMQLLRDTTGADDARILNALKIQNDRVRKLSMQLGTAGALVARARDAYVTFNEISLMSIFSLVYFDGHDVAAERILPLFIRELRTRIKADRPVLRQPVRIGCMHLPFTNPHVDRVFRDSGAAVIVASMYDAGAPVARRDDECARCLAAYFGSRTASLQDKAAAIDRIIDRYQLDAFLFGQFENDRALGGDQLMLMKLVKQQSRLYYMSMNNWQRVTGSDITRIESLAEVIKERETR